MKSKTILILLYVLCVSFVYAQTQEKTLVSPNGEIISTLSLTPEGSLRLETGYRDFSGFVVSRLGITSYTEHLTIKEVRENSKDTVWRPVYGERSSVRDHYNEITVRLGKKNNHHDLLLQLRAYNEGIAFRYIFDEHRETYLHIENELTDFTFPEGTVTYFIFRIPVTFYQPIVAIYKAFDRIMTH
jgi:alpha-glucosidase